jgi:hypothetical protein
MSDAVASLQALWTASEEVTQKRLFSPEFRQWHASVLGILRQQFQKEKMRQAMVQSQDNVSQESNRALTAKPFDFTFEFVAVH